MPHAFVYVCENAADVIDYDLARLERLQREGFAVRVACTDSPALAELEARGFEVRPLPGRARWNLIGRASGYPILQGEFLQDPPTCVHGVGTPWAWIAAYAAKTAGLRGVVATIDKHDLGQPISVRGYRKLASWVHAYVVHHPTELESLISLDVAPPSKFELLLGGRGVDLKRFNPDAEDLVPREIDGRVAVAVRDDPSLTAVIQNINRRCTGIEWVTIRELDPQVLAAVDLFLSLDANPDDLMTAAAMRVAVLVPDGVEARTIVVDHETGRIAPGVDALAAIAIEMLDDPKRLADMGVRAGARARTRFARSHVDDQLLRVYDRVLR